MGVVVDVQNTIVNNAIARWGTDAQKARYLPRAGDRDGGGVCAYRKRAQGPMPSLLPPRLRTEATTLRSTDASCGSRNSAEAGLFVLFANANPSAGYRGITAFLVERGFAGFQCGPEGRQVGIRASSTCELILDNCLVPKENVLGEEGKGYKIAIETLNEGRIGIGAQMVGLAQGALGHAIRYAKQRKQFGQPISAFQGVQFDLAKMATELEAARLLVYNAARLRDAGLPFVKEAAMAKYFCIRGRREDRVQSN